MDLTINGQRIEFALETEKNLGDVIGSVETLARENGSFIESVVADDRLVSLEAGSSELKRMIEEIASLRIVTMSRPHLALESLSTAARHADSVLERLGPEGGADDRIPTGTSIDPDCTDEVLQDLRLIEEAVEGSLRVLGVKPSLIRIEGGVRLDEIIRRMDAFVGVHERRYIDDRGLEEARSFLEALPGAIGKAMRWGAVKMFAVQGSPLDADQARLFDEVLADAARLMRGSIDAFGRIARSLQAGEDGSALADLAFLMELFDGIVAVLRAVRMHADSPAGAQAESLFEEIAARLKDIEEALVNGDMISLGDALEYDIKPRFERFLSAFEKIKFSIDR